MNEFLVLDPSGHTTTEWDPASREQVARARAIYEALVRRGYRAFRVEKGAEGRMQERFDPREKETVFVPPIHAG
ncbi:MAG TPA: hypothetical protein VFC18_22250 [Burkholderiales bacterium]|nr:hypothetical protein [Burkholderiales bacterium]